jgi:diguanylate cyclase (GGDEF)-like protein
VIEAGERTGRVGDSVVAHLLRPGVIEPAFQPIVRIADGEIVAYEALARSTVPLPGNPGDWFMEAQRLGLTTDLDVACLEAIAAAGPPPFGRLLFVNVSPSSLGDPRILALADRLPNRIVIELTEREAIEDLGGLRRHLAWWMARGARIALDDTGAGYASLQQVVQLRPAFLKLDASLVSELATDRTRQALVAALATFAEQVGASVIAEAVETPQQLAWLRAAGVGMAQGFLLARPGPRWPVVAPVAIVPAERADLRLLQRNLEAARSRREACEAVADHLFRRGGLMPSVYIHSTGRLRCYAQRGLWQVLDGMAPTAGITGRTFRSGETQLLADVEHEADYLEAIPGVVAELCVPVRDGGRAGGQVIGALNVESLVSLEPDALDEVEACADLLGRALATRTDQEDTTTLRRLAAVASSLVAVADAAETASAVVAAACELVGTDSGAVLLGDVDTGFEVTHAAGPLEHGLAEMEARDVDHLARVLAPMTSVYSSGDITGLASVGGTTLRDAGAQAVIAVPLIARARRIGILVLANSHPLPIGPSVAESLEVLASVAGSCLETSGDMAELRTRANRDALTGLRNHARFHEELRERSAGRACISLFDIDRFKDVNDTLGHLAGDRVLRETAAALKLAAAPGAMLFRIGGDELAALLPTNDADLAATMATQMIVAARSVLHPFGADLSAGIAVRRDGEDLMDTLHRADAALYRAKAAGGGAVSRG